MIEIDTPSFWGMFYSWLQVGDILVYVADITENADERAIKQQIEAIEKGWA